MTSDKTKANQLRPEPSERADRQKEARNLDVWSRSAPIRLAGYEDDPAESHILRGID
ncbi:MULTISPECIES: hypothetical protein [Streptomyces]|uniref:Uncharacterized protein n=1 Tax=Streptomyces lycii TaxID=2654337 RepID=A0ABQ7FQT1_9ACTN|nr:MULTISPECIES: hypothetical protein [Streptomyces]KAF4410804.1 hypothetical protein GCU69_01970 [Streptomyces lycii]